MVTSWHSSFFSKDDALGPLATGRAGNVIGGGDYAEDRIVPDAVRAFASKQPLILRRPQATRPWQHVLESVSGYLTLGHGAASRKERLGQTRVLNLQLSPDPEAERSVQQLLDAWLSAWPNAISVQANPEPSYGEAARLSLDHSRAVQELGWKPVWDFQATVAQTASWYRQRHEIGADDAAMLEFTRQQISAYSLDAARMKVAWTH